MCGGTALPSEGAAGCCREPWEPSHVLEPGAEVGSQPWTTYGGPAPSRGDVFD